MDPIIGYIVFCSLNLLCYGHAVEGVYVTEKECREAIVDITKYYRHQDTKKTTLYFGECSSRHYYKDKSLGIQI